MGERPSIEYLKSAFSYDQETGVFTRTLTTGPRWKAGSIVSPKNDCYSYVRVTQQGNKAKIYLHVLAWILSYGEWPEYKIHHADDDWKNNRLSNLKMQKDDAHSRKMRVGRANRSGARGVHWDARRQMWRAEITVEYENKFLGRYLDKGEALAAYIAASQKYHGEDGRVQIFQNFEVQGPY